MADAFENRAAESPQSARAHGEQTITVYGVSNRVLNASRDAFATEYEQARMDKSLHYFKETANVARDANGEVHIDGLPKLELIDKNQFQQQLDHSVKETKGKLGVYTHGIRNAPGDAGAKAIELAAATKETFVVEDWASTAATPHLPAAAEFAAPVVSLFDVTEQQRNDNSNSFASQSMINNSVLDLSRRYGAKNIDLVAHSRGSMNQIRLLGALADAGEVVHSATFAHSDVDTNDFALSLPAMSRATRTINILYSPKDKALLGSTLQNEGAKLTDGTWSVGTIGRLGEFGLANNTLINELSKQLALRQGFFHQARDDEPQDVTHHEMSAALVGDMLRHESKYTVSTTNREPARHQDLLQLTGLVSGMAARVRAALHIREPQLAYNSPEIAPYVSKISWTSV